MKQRLVFINEKDLEKFGHNTFVAFYEHQYKFCLAIFNKNSAGSITPISPYFDSIKEVLHNFKHSPKDLGYNYFENFVIVNRYELRSSL